MTTNDINTDKMPTGKVSYKRDVGLNAPVGWLLSGIKDCFKSPFSSLAYGLLAFLSSSVLIYGLLELDLSFLLFPAIAGFMVMGPALAVGLYEKSKQLQNGTKPSLASMVFVRAKSPGQILFIGVMLMLLMMLWLRSAFLLYALFFGLLPFEGFDKTLQTLIYSPRGWALLGVGSIVGGLFAAFAFAISAFSIPMLLDKKTDAFTAMAISWAVSWKNMGVSVVWGSIILLLFLLSAATLFVGLIVIFPILGHATWHAYKEMAGHIEISDGGQSGPS